MYKELQTSLKFLYQQHLIQSQHGQTPCVQPEMAALASLRPCGKNRAEPGKMPAPALLLLRYHCSISNEKSLSSDKQTKSMHVYSVPMPDLACSLSTHCYESAYLESEIFYLKFSFICLDLNKRQNLSCSHVAVPINTICDFCESRLDIN